jgi:hypothetical protein
MREQAPQLPSRLTIPVRRMCWRALPPPWCCTRRGDRPPFTALALEYKPEAEVHGPQSSVIVNPRVLEYDTLIALNQLKVHQTATVTLALKNIVMSYPAAMTSRSPSRPF